MRYYVKDGEYYSHSERTQGRELSKAEYSEHVKSVPDEIKKDLKADYANSSDKLLFIARFLGLE